MAATAVPVFGRRSPHVPDRGVLAARANLGGQALAAPVLPAAHASQARRGGWRRRWRRRRRRRRPGGSRGASRGRGECRGAIREARAAPRPPNHPSIRPWRRRGRPARRR